LGGGMDGAADPEVGGAAAEVPRHRRVDVTVRRIRRLREERGSGHDLPGLAVPALGNVDLLPRALERVAAVLRQALDGGDAGAAHRGDGSDAGAASLAVDEHGAGAALGDAAAELGSLEVQSVAERPEERYVLRSLQRTGLSVDLELVFHVETLAGELNPALSPVFPPGKPLQGAAPHLGRAVDRRKSRRRAAGEPTPPPCGRAAGGRPMAERRSRLGPGPPGAASAGAGTAEEERSLADVLRERRGALELAPRLDGTPELLQQVSAHGGEEVVLAEQGLVAQRVDELERLGGSEGHGDGDGAVELDHR